MEIEYWENERGDVVVLDDIESQPVKLQDKILWVIELLGDVGLALGGPHLKKFRNYDLYELIANQGNLGYRVLFVVRGGSAWFVHSFRKESQATPNRHIKLALGRAASIKQNRRKS